MSGLGGSHTEKLRWTWYNGPKLSLGDMIWENTRLVLMRFSLGYPYKKKLLPKWPEKWKMIRAFLWWAQIPTLPRSSGLGVVISTTSIQFNSIFRIGRRHQHDFSLRNSHFIRIFRVWRGIEFTTRRNHSKRHRPSAGNSKRFRHSAGIAGRHDSFVGNARRNDTCAGNIRRLCDGENCFA